MSNETYPFKRFLLIILLLFIEFFKFNVYNDSVGEILYLPIF